MPYPSSAPATLRPDLQTPFEQYPDEMAKNGYVTQEILPVFNCALPSDTYPVIPAEAMLHLPSVTRSAKSGYSRSDFDFDEDSYTTKEYGFEEIVDDNEAKKFRYFFNYEQVLKARAQSILNRAAEARGAAALYSTSRWNGSSLTTAVSTPWSTIATSKPIDDVKAARKKVYDLCGFYPNALLINVLVYENLIHNAQILDRIAASGAGSGIKPSDVTKLMVAQALNVDKLVIAGASKNSANEGQTLSIAPVYSSSYALLARVATTDDLREPCVGRLFHYGDDGSTPLGTVESYRDETKRCDVIRVRHQVAEKIMYTNAAHLLSNISA